MILCLDLTVQAGWWLVSLCHLTNQKQHPGGRWDVNMTMLLLTSHLSFSFDTSHFSPFCNDSRPLTFNLDKTIYFHKISGQLIALVFFIYNKRSLSCCSSFFTKVGHAQRGHFCLFFGCYR